MNAGIRAATAANSPIMINKPYSAASERNREPILEVLLPRLRDCRRVLEIGSGTGQHAVHFAAAMPWLIWQCADQLQYLPGITSWLDEAGLANTPAPLPLRVHADPPGFVPALPLPLNDGGKPVGYEAAFTANTLHIMGWPEVLALFASLEPVLAERAQLIVYGPFNYRGEFTSDSNRAFDASLRAGNPVSGIRDFEAVDALARGIGLTLLADVAMPANNRCLIWQRDGGNIG